MAHHRLDKAAAARFEADWLEEHYDHLGAGYERGPWSRVLTCTCSKDANHTLEIFNEAHEIALAGYKAGGKLYSYG